MTAAAMLEVPSRDPELGSDWFEVEHVAVDDVSLRLVRPHEAGSSDRFLAWLDAAERARYQRYRHARDAATFAWTRAALRWVLADVVHALPADLCFAVDAAGKPRIVGVPCAPAFSFSRSDNVAAIATAPAGRLGVDIERVPRRGTVNDLASTVLAESELERFQAAPPTDRRRLFFAAWTAKEAVLKAQGVGLLRDPRSCEVLSGTSRPLPRAVEGLRLSWGQSGLDVVWTVAYGRG